MLRKGVFFCESFIPRADAFTKTGKASKVLGNGIVESGLKHLDNVADGIKKLVKKADDAIDLEKHLPKKLLKEEAEAFAKKADKVADDVVEDAAKAIKTSYGKSSGKYDTTADFLTNIENRNGKFYTDKATIDKIGQVEARGEDFSLLNKRIMSSRASTEGGTSVVYKYSDELGTKYLIHEVTDARGYIIHRDFDAVRISLGQLINKGH